MPLSILGFSQIPNFPNKEQPNPSAVQNYSTKNFTHPQNNQNIPALPSSFSSSNTSRIQQQNMTMVQNDFKRIEAEEKEKRQHKYSDEIQKQESKIYLLNSLADKKGTKAYYTAFNNLSKFNPEDYSVADAVFIVENAYYNDDKNFQSTFQNSIQKAVKIIQNQIINKKIDETDNSSKNLAIFQYFAENTKQNGKIVHKAMKYDFEDYMGVKDYSKMFVSKLMKSNTGQCHSMPLFYLILAEQIGAEAFLVMSPNHSYIRYIDNSGEMLSLELTSGMFSANSFVLNSGYIKSEALQNKLYMQNLSKKEVLSQTFVDLASGYIHKFGYDEFVGQVLNKALELNPNNINATLWKSNINQIRFQEACKRLGINYEDKQELQNIRNYPNLVGQLQEINSEFDKIDQSGFSIMPPEDYEQWLSSLNTAENKQKSEEIAERMRLLNAQKQKETLQQQKLKPIPPKKETPKVYTIPKAWL
ncbi:hypothetical protein [Chryseobacterium sp.]|uniref:hypothetical protein n=2 Tax=unclassified Chryseobacterium TaxID=2593645 RepID=UPI000ED8AD59|nr:hypothetical protein [Chryseobacterium sp.]HCM33816.1 hypothetical protein [Chryseobacterium sp.]